MRDKRAGVSNNSKIFKSILTGSFIGILVCTVSLVIISFLFTKSTNFPYIIIGPLMIIIAGLGSFIGGYVSSRISMERGMMCGMLCGFIMFIIIFLSGLILVRESIKMITVIRMLTMLLSGSVGGIVGVNKRYK